MRNGTLCLLCLGVVSALSGSLIVGGATCLVVMLTAVINLTRRIRRQRAQVERDLPALLTTIASSVRAGVDPLTALMNAQQFFAPNSRLSCALREFRRDFSSGEDENVLIQSFLHDLKNPDVELFKRCILLSRRHGASLAEPLHRVVRVVRQRQSFRRKIRAALAMHRMSAIGIACCAIFIAGIQGVMNSSGVVNAWRHPVGGTFLTVGGVLLATGITWMMCMGREEVL